MSLQVSESSNPVKSFFDSFHSALDKLLVVCFTLEDEQGAHLAEFYSELKAQYSVNVLTVNLSQAGQGRDLIVSRFDVKKVPSSLFMIGFEEQDRVEGSQVPEIVRKTEALLKRFDEVFLEVRNRNYARIKELIEADTLVVIKKGDPVKNLRNVKARRVLNGYEYKSVDVRDEKNLDLWLQVYTGTKVFPMVFMGGVFKGSVEELAELTRAGEIFRTLSQDLNSRLEKMTKSSKYFVAMMGSREDPICGFSKRLLAILESYEIDFDTFDISFDNEVCEGLKRFSDWPTYPQVYVNGELIGGYDICNQMHTEGALRQALLLD